MARIGRMGRGLCNIRIKGGLSKIRPKTSVLLPLSMLMLSKEYVSPFLKKSVPTVEEEIPPTLEPTLKENPAYFINRAKGNEGKLREISTKGIALAKAGYSDSAAQICVSLVKARYIGSATQMGEALVEAGYPGNAAQMGVALAKAGYSDLAVQMGVALVKAGYPDHAAQMGVALANARYPDYAVKMGKTLARGGEEYKYCDPSGRRPDQANRVSAALAKAGYPDHAVKIGVALAEKDYLEQVVPIVNILPKDEAEKLMEKIRGINPIFHLKVLESPLLKIE